MLAVAVQTSQNLSEKTELDMQHNESFYMYLPSNLETKGRYPENGPSKYTTPLSDPLYLNDQWEVGLVEIFFPNYQYNIHYPLNESITIEYHIHDEKKKTNLVIMEGQYTPSTYVKAINRAIESIKYEDADGKIHRKPYNGRLKYNEFSKKITLTFGAGESLKVSDKTLRRMLGFRDRASGHYGYSKSWRLSPEVTKRSTGTRTSARRKMLPFPCSFDVNGSRMYVYSSVVDFSHIGNIYSQILRVVPLNPINENHESIRINYSAPHYKKLRSNTINSIDIILANEIGEEIKFKQGNTIVVLHFRKI